MRALTWTRRFASGWNRSHLLRHARGVVLLLAITTALLTWGIHRTETSFADGLRYIHQAEKIEAGSWQDIALRGTDHPLHPLALAAIHRLLGDAGPISWQRAALWLAFTCTVLLVIPIYMVALELYGEGAAWLACLLAIINPLSSYIVVNVLSESTFLLPWVLGLWAAIRFLREGRLCWLLLAITFGVAAYLTRPEGLLLAVALFTTLSMIPLFRATRFERQQSLRLIACVVIGVLVLAGPYIAVRGGLGTKPGIARVLALAPRSNPHALEREKPLAADEPVVHTYRLATIRMFKILRAAVTPTLFPFALLGLIQLSLRNRSQRAAMFLVIVLGASAVALVRLHATGGYGVTRHGLVPGIVLTIASAGALASLAARVKVPGQWLRLGQRRVEIAAPVWSMLLACVFLAINARGMEFKNPSPFAVYHTAAGWLARNVKGAEQVLDMTDWSLYFSERPGYPFADVYKAPGDPSTRWIVVRGPHVEGRWPYTHVIRELIGVRKPVALIPARPAPGQLQVRIYDRGQESAPSVDRIAGAPRDGVPTQHLRQPQATSLHMRPQIGPVRSREQGSGS
jgi:4-amino-4-deoxy-L-arabinose transferase-like glycosyltransferase